MEDFELCVKSFLREARELCNHLLGTSRAKKEPSFITAKHILAFHLSMKDRYTKSTLLKRALEGSELLELFIFELKFIYMDIFDADLFVHVKS